MSVCTCTCTCYSIVAPDGSRLEGEERRDPYCRTHGYPTDTWGSGDPLRRYARWVWRTVFLPAILDKAGHVLIHESEKIVMRLETPRDVESRLYREMRRLRT